MGPKFVDATSDLSHVVLESGLGLTPESTEGGIFEWADGSLKRVSVGPKGELLRGGEIEMARNAISNDGTRVIWSVDDDSGYSGYALFERDMITGKTVLISDGRYQAASSDGSKVFFTNGDLYECEVIERGGELECRLSDLAPGGEVQDVLGVSEDGSYVYFVGQGVLTSVENSEQAKAVPGGENLYVYHDGTTTFIATLSEADGPSFSLELKRSTARVSPNGLWLAFMSQQNLTGYDTHDALREGSDEEVYLYDASTNRLVCPSCEQTGALPAGDGYTGKDKLAGGDRVWGNRTYSRRTSLDGRHIAAQALPISRGICLTAAGCSSTASMRWCRRTSTAPGMSMSTSRRGRQLRGSSATLQRKLGWLCRSDLLGDLR